jgi:protein TilB
MVRITEEMLRKRAEHNEGRLSTLEEVALHQQDIEKLENLDKLCRHVQIVLLQNNIIETIENITKLKELEYLNLALNNIKTIEGLQGNESLKKLDLTCNFIGLEDLEASANHLTLVPSLREIYLLGNPCTDWKRCKEYVIAVADQLDFYDGTAVAHSEKILAKQNLTELLIELRTEIEVKKMEREANPKPADENAYTRENRKQMYLEQAKEKEEKELAKNGPKPEPKKETPNLLPNGMARQCNEGKYEYKLSEWDDPEFTNFEIRIPRFMDTSLLDVNLQPKLISVRIKGKLTQLRLNDEILVEKSTIQRSSVTGILHVKMPKLTVNNAIVSVEKPKAEDKKNNSKIDNKSKEESKEEVKENADKSKAYKEKVVKIEKKIDHTTLDDIPDLE